MKTLSKTIFVLAVALSLGGTAFGGDEAMNPCGQKTMTVFHVDDPMGRNSVTFKSEAPLEDIIGTSNEITGQIWFDPGNPQNGGSGQITVPVASLNTGIPLRDDHLRGADWLNADKFPNIELKINKVGNLKRVKSATGSDTYDLTLFGEFSFHGHSQKVEFPGRITYLKESDLTRQRVPGDLLAARANFSIPLSDYGVTGPKGMNLVGSKVGETIDIEVSFVGNTAASMAENPCGSKATAGAGNPCNGKAMTGAGNPCGGKAMKKAGNPCGEKASGNAGSPCSR